MTAVSPLRVPVLMYHEIADATATPSRLAVSPEAFADQVAYLRDEGFTGITAGELSAILAGGPGELPERPVVVTFDDGYGDFYSHALPLLKQHDLTGTIFMTTGWIGVDGVAKRMLNWTELAEVAEYGIEIGAHTCRHPQLDQLRVAALREELYASKSLLEDKLGFAVPGVAYPFGYSNGKVRQMARDLGYVYGYGVDNAMSTRAADKFSIPRLTVGRTTSMDSFVAMVNGQDTKTLRRDRVLSKGFTVVRRTRAGIRVAQDAIRPSAR
jgi:peptidoglycan/xylan/chitin deacetylase (PgdA/CDA1 family)